MPWWPCWDLCFQAILSKLSAVDTDYSYLLTQPSPLSESRTWFSFGELPSPWPWVPSEVTTVPLLPRTRKNLSEDLLFSTRKERWPFSLGFQAERPHKPEATHGSKFQASWKRLSAEWGQHTEGNRDMATSNSV